MRYAPAGGFAGRCYAECGRVIEKRRLLFTHINIVDAELELGVPGIVGTECGKVESSNNAWIGMKTLLLALHKIFYRFDT